MANTGWISALALFLVLWLAGPARADTVTFEQNANGQPQFLPGNTGTTPNFYFPDDNDWNQVLVTGSGVYNGQTYSYTEQPSNWSTDNSTYPNSPSTSVLIDALPVTLNVNVTVDSLTLSNGAVIDIDAGNTLNVDGVLTDNGSIVINTGGNAVSVLTYNGTVSGTGSFILENGYDGGENSVLSGAVTQAAGHTISGNGQINGALSNYGLVNADGPGGAALYLESTNMTNYSTMESTSGGLLDIDGITVTQGTGGQLFANGGDVQFDGDAAVSGGTLNSSGTASVFNINITATTTFSGLTNNAPVNVLDGGVLNITNGLVDNGSISVDPSGNVLTVLNFEGATVSGTGTIFLDNAYNENAELSGTLTQTAGHTISGQGEIDAALTNYGIVNANVYNAKLTLAGNNMVNYNVMEASGGDVLDINGITVTEGTNGQLFANGGNVQFDGSPTVSGGTLNSSGTASVFNLEGTATVTFNALTNKAPVNVQDGGVLNITNGLVDNGSISVDPSGNVTTVLNIEGGTVSGTGTIFLDNAYNENAELSGTLTQALGHTISGQGEIDAALTNYGIVNANVYDATLTLTGNNMVNYNVMEASGGDVLDINGITITEGTNGQLFANGGNVQFDGSPTVSGGTLNSSGTASVFNVEGTAIATFNALTNKAPVNVQDGGVLNITNGLVDNGSISVDPSGSNVTTVLNIEGGTVSGTGAIFLDNAYNDDAQLSGTLTQALGHTISGQGEIDAALTNYGIVNANVYDATLTLTGNNMVNYNVMEASGGDILDINGITVTQGTNGQLFANGGTVQFDGSPTVSGGTLNSSGTASVFNVEGSATATFNALTNKAPVNVQDGGVLNITNGLVDNGAISVDPSGSNVTTVLNIEGGMVSGTGTIFLDNGYNDNAQLTGKLTQEADHTISGQGEIDASLANYGLVNANNSGATLLLTGSNMANYATIESSGGGVLDISGITVSQGAAGQIFANGGSVKLDSATVSAGTLNSSTSTDVFTVNSGVVTFKSVVNDAAISMADGTTLNITAGMVDNGTITMQESGAINVTGNLTGNGSILVVNGGDTMSFGGGTVSGTGTIALDETQVSGALTQSAGHTISGSGGIDGGFTNNGLLNADVYNQTLTLSGSNMFNNGIMESSGGGGEVLEISGITITQGTNGELYANGGNVQFDGAAGVSGGALDSSTSTSVFTINSGTSTFNSVTNDAPVNIVAGSTLNITGSLTDNGSIEVNSNDSGAVTDLNFAGGSVTGSGTIILNAGNPYAQLTGALTQAAGHTISGFGVIDAGLTNNGLVDADVYNQILYLTGSNITNNGVMESTTGGAGVLDIYGITVTQGTNGKLFANGGNVQFDSATVSGGALDSSTSTSLFVLNSGTSVFHSLTNNATVNMVAGTTLNITGSLTDNGSIVVDSGNNSTLTVLDVGGGTVSGSGSIILNANYGDAQLTGALTQAAGHTISGFGYVVAALINDGLVNASVYNDPLYLTGNNMTNNGVMESTTGGGGGVLDISGITISQGAGGELLANGGNVQFDGASKVSGGALDSSTSTSIFIVNSGTATFASLTNNATVNILAGNAVNVTGNLIDNGEIVVDSGGNSSYTAINLGGGTVSGSGAIILNEPYGDAQVTGTLTQGGSHTISGFGVIAAALTNAGTVNADVNNQTLYVGGKTTNSGLMEASGGGTLSIAPGVLTNLAGSTLTSGSYEALAGSTISLSATITNNSATVILNGPGSTFSAINSLTVNAGGFEVLGGQTFTTEGALVNSGAVDAVGGAIAVNGAFSEDGSGTLAVTTSGSFSDTDGYLGTGASHPAATVSGSGSSWTNTGSLAVGYTGTGTLMVTNGGAVSDVSGYIGYAAGSSGVVTVSGSGSKWSTGGGVIVGDLGTGTLTITDGGAVSVTGATTIGSGGTLQFDGASSFSTAALAVNGGKLVTLGAATFTPSATLGAGGMNVNSDGFSSTFSGSFSGAGGIAKSGSGAITLTGVSTYTGATAVNAGTLALITGAGHTAALGNTAITVASGAAFDASAGAAPFSRIVSAGTTASGSLGATLTLDPGSRFSMAGASLATFDLQQESAFSGPAFTIGGASGIAPSLIFDIGNAATGPDLLRVTDTVHVLATGGDITIDPLAGDTSLTVGSYYLIISAGGFSGTGGNGLILSGTTLAVDGTTYDLSLAHSTADDEILTVSDAPAAPSGLTDEPREEALGGSSAVPAGKESAPLAGTTAVPEPSTMMSLLSVMATAWMLRRRG